MGDTAYIPAPKDCDICGRPAHYDARTRSGQWANLCQQHFDSETNGELGTGLGQRLIVGDAPKRTDKDIRRDILAALEAGDFEAAFDAAGDEDPLLYL